MKRVLFAGAAIMALVGAATAADLPRRMPVKAAPPAPVYDWNGFYLGGYYATSLAHSEATSALAPGKVGLNDDGIAGGLDLGYNWQFNPSWLVGVEGDIGYLNTNRRFHEFNDVATFAKAKATWYGTLRGRVGYVTGPSLLYVTGGGAWVRLEEQFGTGTAKDTQSGWTAGVGIETKLSRSWTAKTEYLFVDAGSNSFATGTSAGVGDVATFKNQFHIIKTGVNYKFGEPLELPLFLAPLSSPQRWAGLYAGVNAGLGLSQVHTPGYLALGGGEVDVNGTGFAGGGHLGYNWGVFSNWIVGVEGDIGYLGISNSKADWFNTGVAGTLYEPGVETSWYGTVRGRVGTSTGPALLYATAGFAAVNVENSATVGAASYSVSGTRTGYAFGGGIEVELTPRWSARLEDLYIHTGTESLAVPGGTIDFRNNFHIVRAGLTYRFGGLDALTAKY